MAAASRGRPYVGGLGFGFKWNMGWMHDTLEYFSKEPVHRRYHHNQLTFAMLYAFTENFVLPLSHDEVVHGKGSLLGKMPGDDWQNFANLRSLFGYMWAHPGKKLLFMGGEFGQDTEWNQRGRSTGTCSMSPTRAAMRRGFDPLKEPISTYEVHAESWRLGLGWKELAEQLVAYADDLGFTHVEFMPVMHHPFSGSWGYQVTGFYAPQSTMGEPDEFRALVDALHQAGIGVILDWVPAHFPRDEFALARFDGTALYEHEDPRRGSHPDWGTLVFNLGRNEVRNFLIANALYWLREYHADGLRVDAVASMLYLDYSRKAGEWVPNAFGGREDLDAVSFLRELNEVVYGREPGVMTIAEESTAWPGVSRPTYLGGLGFGFKWNMGWMHDTLEYVSKEPVHRRFHHHELTFSMVYAWNENFVLPLSHDEVVHGKGSLIGKMPGDRWQRFANLRALYGYMWSHPGKQLLFMGCEFGQEKEWSEPAGSLDWHLLDEADHAGMLALMRDLNAVYVEEPALWELDHTHEGFLWLEPNAANENVLAYARRSADGKRWLVVACNFAPVVREGWRIGLPKAGKWREALNTDSRFYGGSDVGNGLGLQTEKTPWNEQLQSAEITLPPLGVVWLVPA